MKVAILAGGYGSRLAEETGIRPKALVEIGNHPIIWHIMRHYSHYNFNNFVIALGYEGDMLKRYFVDYQLLSSNLTVNLQNGTLLNTGCSDNAHPLKWVVELVDTGVHTMTGGRIKRLAPHLGKETFMLTWCDGVSNINLNDLLAFHRSHGKLATLSAVHPNARFGYLDLEGHKVTRFSEKLQSKEGFINGAFFVLEPGVFDYIPGDATSWEEISLARLAEEGQLMAYQHDGFWQCMDTVRDKQHLENIWQQGNAPWKTWE